MLEAAGSGTAHVEQTSNYVRDSAVVPRFKELYREYFSAPYPSRTKITKCLPPTLRYEIECVAVVKRWTSLHFPAQVRAARADYTRLTTRLAPPR